VAFGIDFGTTNSAVSYKGVPLTVGGRPFASIVAVNRLREGDIRCGPAVKGHQTSMAKDYHVISSVKRYLDPRGAVFEPFQAAGVLWTPEQIATALFRSIRKFVEANKHLTESRSLDEAVVSIPVGFPVGARRTLRRAAACAGICITSFISEPTAAFLHCRPAMAPHPYLAVFDWGGGTLDVSILRIQGELVEEVATEGWGTAGDEIDVRIAEWIHEQVANRFPKIPAFHQVSRNDRDLLLHNCEELKIRLSTTNRDAEDALLDHYGGLEHVPIKLPREVLHSLVRPLVDDAIGKLSVALDKARLPLESIGQLLLVGGSSRIVSLRERLEDLMPGRVYQPEEDRVDFVVAQGASALGGQRDHAQRHQLMQRLCLRLSDNLDHDLFPAGAPFDGQPRPTYLGVVDRAATAQLLFTESVDHDMTRIETTKPTRPIGYLSAKVQGFIEERIVLWCTLTDDLTFHARAVSERLDPAVDSAEWEYANLRFAYTLPPYAPNEPAR
jgi:molecular chaperone DnaK